DVTIEQVVKNEINAVITAAQRDALLEGQSRWLEEVERAETLTQRTIARVIADALGHEAERYKITSATIDFGESVPEPELPSIDESPADAAGSRAHVRLRGRRRRLNRRPSSRMSCSTDDARRRGRPRKRAASAVLAYRCITM